MSNKKLVNKFEQQSVTVHNVMIRRAGQLKFVREAVLKLEGHSRAVTGLEVLPDSGNLVSCSLDGCILVWDYVNTSILQRFEHPSEMLCIALRIDHGEVLVGTNKHDILRFKLNL